MTVRLPTCEIVVPAYNGAVLTEACVESLLRNPPQECSSSILVVDDGSSDRTVEKLSAYSESVRLIGLENNSGFATACNIGAANTDCEFLVFLNNDTIVTQGWLDALVRDALTHPDAVAVGAKLLFPNGAIQHAGVSIGGDGWPRHLYVGFPGEHPAVNRPKWMVAATAACLLVRKKDFDSVNGFDLSFHNGFEDIDLCLRLGECEQRTRYSPTSVVYHLESVTRWHDVRRSTAHNDALYEARWRTHVRQDDLQHYMDDGLLTIDYGQGYPLTMELSPLLAVAKYDDAAIGGVEGLLKDRAEQVMDLLFMATRASLRERTAQVPSRLSTPPDVVRSAKIICEPELHKLGSGKPSRVISVLIPVKNEARSLRELIPLVLAQDISASLELVAVDSGSSDDTIDVLRGFGAKVVTIDPKDFNHGLTRNLAAREARGELLVFLNGRSRPTSEKWLGPLLAAFDGDPSVVGVCSRTLPYHDANVLVKAEGTHELSGALTQEQKRIDDWDAYRSMTHAARRAFLNFHTVSAVIRADIFATIPFRSVRTIGEDLLWAREVLEEGWTLVHEPASCVYHSHPYTIKEIFCRNVDDGVANRDIVGRVLDEHDLRPLVDTLVSRDWEVLRATQDLDTSELDWWLREAFFRRIAQVVGQWVGVNYQELPQGMATYFSRIGHQRQLSDQARKDV